MFELLAPGWLAIPPRTHPSSMQDQSSCSHLLSQARAVPARASRARRRIRDRGAIDCGRVRWARGG